MNFESNQVIRSENLFSEGIYHKKKREQEQKCISCKIGLRFLSQIATH